MKKSRREFITETGMAAFAAGLIPGSLKEGKHVSVRDAEKYVPDAGIKLCFAYFGGIEAEKRKVAFGRQLNVLGAVGGINPAMVGMKDANPCDLEVIMAVKNAWKKEGLNLEVIEGPPSLGEKTKLGLDGRDEEISGFINLMKNLSRAGINIICYNWMPVISWARTATDLPGRGGALVTAFDYEKIKDNSLTKYGAVTKDALWKNLEYFLKAVIPEALKAGIMLAMHPDDPQVDSIRGISRIMTTSNSFRRMHSIRFQIMASQCARATFLSWVRIYPHWLRNLVKSN